VLHSVCKFGFKSALDKDNANKHANTDEKFISEDSQMSSLLSLSEGGFGGARSETYLTRSPRRGLRLWNYARGMHAVWTIPLHQYYEPTLFSLVGRIRLVACRSLNSSHHMILPYGFLCNNHIWSYSMFSHIKFDKF
jgi:hypothetical protein